MGGVRGASKEAVDAISVGGPAQVWSGRKPSANARWRFSLGINPMWTPMYGIPGPRGGGGGGPLTGSIRSEVGGRKLDKRASTLLDDLSTRKWLRIICVSNLLFFACSKACSWQGVDAISKVITRGSSPVEHKR
jgi:hypothetical protein